MVEIKACRKSGHRIKQLRETQHFRFSNPILFVSSLEIFTRIDNSIDINQNLGIGPPVGTHLVVVRNRSKIMGLLEVL